MNYGYHFARFQGWAIREVYRCLLPLIARQRIPPPNDIPLTVFAYSGEATLPEQVVSVRSFLQHAGRPLRFVIVSDGTYSRKSIALLHAIDPCVSVSNAAERIPRGLPDRIYPYLAEHPTGKQLALIMSLPENGATLYVDSDVIFFPGATELAQLLTAENVPAFYLADCRHSADDRLFRSRAEQTHPVNTGVALLFRPLDWSLAVERFLELSGPPTFFTNQTMTQLAMHRSGAVPLDPVKYVLQLDDQFIYPDRYASDSLALRHYVNPVRHKLWAGLLG